MNQLVSVQMLGSKLILLSVLLVMSNVLNVTKLLIIVLLVPKIVFMNQFVVAQVVGIIMVELFVHYVENNA